MASEGFEEIYRAYFGAVYRYALRLCGDPVQAEDIAADTFFKAMGALDGFRGECDMRGWLCRIARNSYVSALRRQRPAADVAALAETLPDPAPAPEERLLRRERADDLYRALDALPEPYREVFTLHAAEQMGFRQIGAWFGHTANWACVTYHRARKMLQERMKEL